MPNASRRYPLKPISCAASIVMRGESVLLIQRGSEPNYGAWTFPGGAMVLGETSRECAARETREETGLEIEILEIVETVDALLRDDAGGLMYQYFIADYLAKPVGGSLRAATDALQVRWVSFDSASQLNLAPPTGEVLRKAIKRWNEI